MNEKLSFIASKPLMRWGVGGMLFIALFLEFAINLKPVFAQTAQQTANPASTIDGDFNDVIQIPNQNNVQNTNINEFNVPNYPLDNPIYTPANTENDFGFNMSVGVNTLDSSNVTIYLGIIYQPGRSNSHQIRMERLKQETQLLEVQRKIAEAQLQQIQQQISQAERRLQQSQ